MASAAAIDRRWIARGVERSSTWRFALWLIPWALLLSVGIYAAGLCLLHGLNQTNMDNRFPFGLWIFLDLSVIALGAGAFFTGFLVYILKRSELKPVLNSAVVIGFICYSGAVAILVIDVGQPLRAWFTFWHPNTHSMLTEVTFCITCYLLVLALEYMPVVLRNRQLRKIPSFLVFEYRLHLLVPVLAGVGTLLSFFHQGSLGGLYGVLRGRPFAFREGFAIWPSTFFLFIFSALAAGPSFLLLITALVEKLTGRRQVEGDVLRRLGFISGILSAVYVVAKSIDTLMWLNVTSPALGFAPWEHYSHRGFGIGTVVRRDRVIRAAAGCAFALFARGAPARLDVYGRGAGLRRRAAESLHSHGADTRITHTAVRRIRQLPPSWQEIASFGGLIAYGVIVYSLSYRYLPLFPQEKREVTHVSGH